MKRVTLALALFAAISFSAAAQDFTPYPYIQLQGGVSYDFSEAADFAKLLSPAAQVAVGYRFDELWGARIAVNGWNAKHTSQDTQTLYGFQFVQPNLDLILDWSSALCGWRPDRPVTVYSFVGAGAAIGLENKKANELAESEYFKAIWQPVKTFWSIRPGLGVDIRLSNRISFNLEFDAHFLPESFNSRICQSQIGMDVHLALLGGLKFNLDNMHESVVSRQIVILIRTARGGGNQELIRCVLGQGMQPGGRFHEGGHHRPDFSVAGAGEQGDDRFVLQPVPL